MLELCVLEGTKMSLTANAQKDMPNVCRPIGFTKFPPHKEYIAKHRGEKSVQALTYDWVKWKGSLGHKLTEKQLDYLRQRYDRFHATSIQVKGLMNQKPLPMPQPKPKLPKSVEERLSTSHLPNKKELGGGVNESIIVSNDVTGVFKPVAGECPNLRRGIDKGTYANREAAAYQIDKAMELDLVPPTIVRKIGKKKGSLQHFSKNSKTYNDLSFFREGEKDLINFIKEERQLKKMSTLDIIIGNTDRHRGNVMVQKIIEKGKTSYKLVAIDNGLAFYPLDASTMGYTMRIRSYAWDELLHNSGIYDLKLPPDVLIKVKRLLEKEGEVRKILLPLLKESEVDGIFARAKFISTRRRLPRNQEEMIHNNMKWKFERWYGLTNV